VSARILSLPMHGAPHINALVLRSGRWIDGRHPGEVLVSEQFAKGARLRLGDSITATVRGKQLRLAIVGTALSPEFIYSVPPGQLTPDNRRFGVLWMGRDALAAALDMDGAFNEVLAISQRGADQGDIIRRLDLLLGRHGGVAAYGRDQQMSDRYVVNELDQLRTMTGFLPPIFLGIAVFLLNIMLARLIETERESIGLLKAFGYRDGAIALHYMQLALLLSVVGLALGVAMGSSLGRGLARMYQEFFVFPFLQFSSGIDVYATAVLATLAAVLLGSAGAVRRAMRLAPAEAMRPPTPQSYGGAIARWLARARRLDEPTRIILRDLARRPLRSGLTVLGIAAALALYITSAGSTDNVDKMIDIAFNEVERQDLTVTFAEPRDRRALFELARIPGVQRVEPLRAVAARLRSGMHVERQGLSGAGVGNDLSRIVDLDGHAVAPPEFGVAIASSLAKKLGIGRGDMLDIEVSQGRQPRLHLPVTGIVDSPVGAPAFLSLTGLNRQLYEGPTVTGAALAIDPHAQAAVHARLKASPMVAGVASRDAALTGVRDTIARSMGLIGLFVAGFAAMLVFGVVYNSGRIMLSERARDLASLRVLGYRRGEVAYVLLGALALLTLAALPLGSAIGIALSLALMEQFSNDLFTIPFGMRAATIAKGWLVVLAAATVTGLLIKARIDRLDLVNVLKTRE
jgi:putative ABC transport system permease protein